MKNYLKECEKEHLKKLKIRNKYCSKCGKIMILTEQKGSIPAPNKCNYRYIWECSSKKRRLTHNNIIVAPYYDGKD